MSDFARGSQSVGGTTACARPAGGALPGGNPPVPANPPSPAEPSEPSGHPVPQSLLAAIVQNSDDAIISKDLNGIVATWNPAATRIFGYQAEEMIGKPMTRLLPADRLQEENDLLARLRRGERIQHFETIRVTKDGRHLPVSLTISPVKDAEGRIVGASKIARDISAQKQHEAELRQAIAAAEAADRAKNHFLSVLSHELRTPLTPVLAAVTHLEDDLDLPLEVRNELGIIRRNIQRESKLIDELLDFTLINAGRLNLRRHDVDVHGLLRQILISCQSELNARRIELQFRPAASRPYLHADGHRLRQALAALVHNAIKFTPPGGRIAVQTRDDADDQTAVVVNDTGAGIDASVLPDVFNPFHQGPNAAERCSGGLGLGLTIAKAIADAHGATLEARSDGPGRGATFTLRMAGTRRQPAAGGSGSRPGRTSGPLRILLVEDHEDTARVLERLLRSRGHDVSTAGTVQDALRRCEDAQFDLLISDIGLPDGTGLDVMRRLRPRGLRGIALSGLGMDDDIRRSRDAGFELHLTKPVNFQTLESVIGRLAG